MENDTQAVAALDPDRLRLLKARLGSLFDWKRPAIIESVGPFMPEMFERFENELQEIVAKCCAQLNRYTDEQVTNILTLPTDGAVYTRSWASFLINDVRYLEKRIPEWHSGGFGHPDHVADFDYWAKMPGFSIEELTCLSIGIEPDNFPKKTFLDLGKSDPKVYGLAIQFLLRRYEQLKRQFELYSYKVRADPKDFLIWVDRVGFKTHPEFYRQLRQYHDVADVVSSNAKGKGEPMQREIDKIAQLITAMAIDDYGYRPSQLKSSTPKDICDLAAEMGLQISTDTILKYLKIGASFIPDDWKPDKR